MFRSLKTLVPSLLALAVAGAWAQATSWKNVRIDGGGFVSGIVFNQGEPDLIYARTDIGGMYRWAPATRSWVPLLDWVGWARWGWNGVASVATDPRTPQRVYAAVGMYTNGWDPNPGAILRSTDKGQTWAATPLPFKLGGNMPGRGMGERLAVDPNLGSILYFGAPSGQGLWKSSDSGATWARVASFPNPGNYAQDPGDANGYLSDNQGVVWVTFDQAARAGAPTQNIFVGVADKQNTVYRSRDAGATWERIAGQPTGYIAHKGVHDHVNGFLYIATSDTGGPYDGGKGDVWKLDTASGQWTQISPIPSSSSDNHFGYSGLTIDRQHPGTLMVGTQVAWWPDTQFFRSTNGGASWTRIWDWGSYPARSFRYTMDITEVPRLSFGNSPSLPEVSPKLGWMNESIEIDPFNSQRFMYGTGATLYASENLLNWDSGGKVTLKPAVRGLEETAVLDLVSPPTGAPLYSALGDIGGFRHDDLAAVPALMYQSPPFITGTGIDFAELKPAVMVRVGQGDGAHIGISTTAGDTWWAGQEPAGVTGGGSVAVSADGATIVWSPAGAAVSRSTTLGSSWAASAGVPAGALVRADRVNPLRFYAFANGSFYVSVDGGASFSASAAGGLPTTARFKAVPGREGDVWLAGGSGGLWHSTNPGQGFSKLANVEQAHNIGFGKAAPGAAYVALYAVAQVGGVQGVFRSVDGGATWLRVNDDQHQYGNLGDAITGDPRVFGRVYVGSNGRGILVGESTETPPPSPPPPPPPSSAVTLVKTSEWSQGYCASVTVGNGGTAPLTWTVTLSIEGTIYSLWNAVYSVAGTQLTAQGVDWNRTLAPGGTAQFGFCANR